MESGRLPPDPKSSARHLLNNSLAQALDSSGGVGAFSFMASTKRTGRGWDYADSLPTLERLSSTPRLVSASALRQAARNRGIWKPPKQTRTEKNNNYIRCHLDTYEDAGRKASPATGGPPARAPFVVKMQRCWGSSRTGAADFHPFRGLLFSFYFFANSGFAALLPMGSPFANAAI